MPDLNPHQNKAVNTLSGPLLVLAGAGSGKTRVITFRIVELIQSGIKPSRILAVTFTNKAAKEMKHRASELLGKRRRKTESPEISTFHSLCVRILRRHIHRLGYPKEFPIYDSGDQEALARQALRDIRVGHEQLRPGDLMSQIGTWKSQGLRPAQALDVATGDREQLAAHAYGKYQEALKASGAVDFDDILLCTEELFDKFPEVRFAEASRFDHLLIDEYQDTNGLQYRIVKVLAERHRNICVVGDDDQSIYGWRGAEVTHILNFANDWPDATVVRLEDNYRSREPILALANTLIRHNATRHQKVLRAFRKGGEQPRVCRFEDETAEAEAIVREIGLLVQSESSEQRVKASDIAILFRTNEQPRAFEVELRRLRIPYVMVGGMSFYDRKEVRDVLAYLRVIAYPKDEVNLLRIINTPPRGIGTQTVQTLLTAAVAKGLPLWEVLPEAKDNGDIAEAVSKRIEEFRLYLDGLRERFTKQPLALVAREMLEQLGYRRELERVYKTGSEVDARWACVEELINSMAIYEERTAEPTLLGFLEETTLGGRDDARDDKGKKTEHAVTLMTLHSAKGLEFPRVYMVGLEEGILPHQRSLLAGSASIAEERRLAYVGVTRAQDFLTLSLAKQRMKWGKPRPSIVSRFLLEMRGETEKAAKAASAAEEALVLNAPKPGDKTSGAQRRDASGKPARTLATPKTNKRTAKTASKPSRVASRQAAVGPKVRRSRPGS
jgi:DNA helicase II / ATP-dependent DNA helicase PcrA